MNERKLYLGYYIPSKENFIYALLYHIVYHKAFIDDKYKSLLKKFLKLKIVNLNDVTKIVDNYLLSKKYKITRPLDLTIPVTYQLDSFNTKNEISLVKDQIDNRNFSGANKMLYNLLKFQKYNIYFQKRIFFLIVLNQFSLIKLRFKNFIYKNFSLND